MQVAIKQNDGINFTATTSNATFEVKPKEVSPVELFAVGMISCSGTDMVMVPENQGHTVTNLEISADIQRAESSPKVFEHIHINYRFDSDADDMKAKRWVQSSLETYCSTINTVRNVARITYGITHNGNELVRVWHLSHLVDSRLSSHIFYYSSYTVCYKQVRRLRGF
jgi:putative redox protein